MSERHPLSLSTVIWPAVSSTERSEALIKPKEPPSGSDVDSPVLDLPVAAMATKAGDEGIDEQEEMVEKLFEETSCVDGDGHIDRACGDFSPALASTTTARCEYFS